jgi:hypothetical protein
VCEAAEGARQESLLPLHPGPQPDSGDSSAFGYRAQRRAFDCLGLAWETAASLDPKGAFSIGSNPMRYAIVLLIGTLAFGVVSCSTYLDDLNRAEAHFQANEHERALALFRAVEPDLDSLGPADRARYAYLRGMNAYRLGTPFRADARHWLAVARAEEKQHEGSLKSEWKERADEALRDLNQDVYGTGVVAESDNKDGAKADSPSDVKSEKKDESRRKDPK